jgi:hypothetical protein
MSYPNDKVNPWKSLADLLSNKTDVAALATAIEEKGIRTWDRFGRMKEATKGDANDLYSQARALDLLASVHELTIDEQGSYKKQGELMHLLDDGESPLVRFGWPSDECPDFNKYKPEHTMPKTISQAGQPNEDGLLGTKERKKLYAIIRALMKEANMTTEQLYKTAGMISIATKDANGTPEVSTNCVADHLNRIFPKSA